MKNYIIQTMIQANDDVEIINKAKKIADSLPMQFDYVEVKYAGDLRFRVQKDGSVSVTGNRL